MKNWLYAALILLATTAVASIASASQALPQGSQGPSFPCKPGQDAVEATICANEALSASDREMAALYASNRISAFGSGSSNELAAQRQTVKSMNECSHQSQIRDIAWCLKTEYDQRNYELALGAIMRAPDLAFPVIRRTDPVFAPIAEAIAIWASEPENTVWSAPSHTSKRNRIIALLNPTVTDMLTKDDKSVAQEMLANSETPIKQTADILISPKHFAYFLNVIGPFLDDKSSAGGGEIPCAAIVRHPALLAATASAYGSTMDNFVLRTDCEQTLPATPALASLDKKLNKGWPTCDGTIRFAAYRTYAMSVDAARLGIASHDPKAATPRRRGVSSTDVSAARTELSAYYAQYLGKTRAQAALMAADAIRSILSDAQECE